MMRLASVPVILFSMVCCCACFTESLPVNWPIPKLTLPPGTRVSGKIITPSNASIPIGWLVFFTGGGSDQAVTSHVESCLKPLGYLKQVDPQGNSSPVDALLDYYSANLNTKVEVTLLEVSGKRAYLITKVSSDEKKLLQETLNRGNVRLDPL